MNRGEKFESTRSCLFGILAMGYLVLIVPIGIRALLVNEGLYKGIGVLLLTPAAFFLWAFLSDLGNGSGSGGEFNRTNY